MISLLDAHQFLGGLEDASVDLLLTSPPYADRRSDHYPTITAADYPAWTVGWMNIVRPKLKPAGSVIMVIRSQVNKGFVSPYLLRTRLALYDDGWREPEELLWIKPTAPPVGHKRRPRRSWEHILWFSRNPQDVYSDPKANGHPSKHIGMDKKRRKKQMELGIYVNYPTPERDGVARCVDFCQVGTGECQRDDYNTHPAQYPTKLCDWVIKLTTPEGGLVVDPFAGSGTTLVSALALGRRALGCDLVDEYIQVARRRLGLPPDVPDAELESQIFPGAK